MKELARWQVRLLSIVALTVFSQGTFTSSFAAPVPGGTLDPLTIPKYVTPLVIPPVMPKSTVSPAPIADYDIAVRQFKQQILPAGFAATTVWSYGRAQDVLPANFVAPAPLSSNISFNYPAFTVENRSGVLTKVRWINDLVANPAACAASANKSIPACNFLPHLFPVDQTLHWANPTNAGCVDMMMPGMVMPGTDCSTQNPLPYIGPVPLVTHVHGAHVQPDSDGYPEAWWLPGAPGTKGIPLTYVAKGKIYTQANNANTVPGSAFYAYENTQPATTLWYHDHAMGMTRLNVYAGPAGFWLIRGGANETAAGVLPGPAPAAGAGDPNFDPAYRATIREIPIAIQDRSFNADGSLFYPADRSFFDGFTGPYINNTAGALPSDISGIWNPEAFFNTMVVNGTTWPKLDVDPVQYRFRLLNGCNSRTLNLSMYIVQADGTIATLANGTFDPAFEVPFYQIGAEQGFLRNVVKIQTGSTTILPGNGTAGTPAPTSAPEQALLMGPAERADVIVDFTGIPANSRIRVINTAPDGPFGGFPDVAADPLTSGQVMEFVVNNNTAAIDPSTPVLSLSLPAEPALAATTIKRQVSLNELSSTQVCVEIDAVTGAIIGTLFSTTPGDTGFAGNCAGLNPLASGNVAEPMGPRQAQLGVLTTDAMGMVMAMPMMWSDPITETPLLNSTEVWEIYNTTMDAHPIHLHLVRFEVVDRQGLDMMTMQPIGAVTPANPNEDGYKDTVLAYPGQITRLKAKFDIAGLYVWHCHIVEHEDNEMMRPYVVTIDPAFPDLNGDGRVDRTDVNLIMAEIRKPGAKNPAYDLNKDGKIDLLDVRIVSSKLGTIA